MMKLLFEELWESYKEHVRKLPLKEVNVKRLKQQYSDIVKYIDYVNDKIDNKYQS